MSSQNINAMSYHEEAAYKSFVFENSSEAYPVLLDNLFREGKVIPSRLGRTLELSVVTNIINPKQFVPFVWGRRFNYFGMLAESLWPMSNVDEVEIIRHWNEGIVAFSDDGKRLYGAYGPRIIPYLAKAVQTLVDDESSRQVVIPILNHEDVGKQTKDFPCNTQVMFKIRDERLHMTVMNRSNDIHWGLAAVNLPQFAMLQNVVASAINHYPARHGDAADIKLGVQRHVSDSLHLYMDLDSHQEITKNMLYGDRGMREFDFYNIVYGQYVGSTLVPSSSVQEPYSFHAPDTKGWIPNTNDDLVWQVYTAAINGGELRPEAGAFMQVAKILLETYVQVKAGKLTRKNAIDNMYNALYELTDKFDEGDLKRNTPLDYIFGCLYTLVSQSRASLREEYAVIAALSFTTLAKRLCGIDIDARLDRNRLEKFLAYG